MPAIWVVFGFDLFKITNWFTFLLLNVIVSELTIIDPSFPHPCVEKTSILSPVVSLTVISDLSVVLAAILNSPFTEDGFKISSYTPLDPEYKILSTTAEA